METNPKVYSLFISVISYLPKGRKYFYSQLILARAPGNSYITGRKQLIKTPKAPHPPRDPGISAGLIVQFL